MRDKKFHIYQHTEDGNFPLCYDDGRVIEFNTYAEVVLYTRLYPEFFNYYVEDNIIIKHDILFYDGGYISINELINLEGLEL